MWPSFYLRLIICSCSTLFNRNWFGDLLAEPPAISKAHFAVPSTRIVLGARCAAETLARWKISPSPTLLGQKEGGGFAPSRGFTPAPRPNLSGDGDMSNLRLTTKPGGRDAPPRFLQNRLACGLLSFREFSVDHIIVTAAGGGRPTVTTGGCTIRWAIATAALIQGAANAV